ncbi:hypothetical protein Pmani_023928 [Petrolisthes manimaculis]|uniref:Uncharacterized protein n=1 Tax=Petrolisthes manimaculis TaxID=1843537 RepID=A0AAE1PBD3_9EUCA|nr:hypothetical protein Pmani_023928 [Petrolisthes manimaculis]
MRNCRSSTAAAVCVLVTSIQSPMIHLSAARHPPVSRPSTKLCIHSEGDVLVCRLQERIITMYWCFSLPPGDGW